MAMGSKALKYLGVATLGSGDPISAVVASSFGVKKLLDKDKSSDKTTTPEVQTPKQGDVSYQEVNDVKQYTPSSTPENYDNFGYGVATDTNALFKKRRPLGS